MLIQLTFDCVARYRAGSRTSRDAACVANETSCASGTKDRKVGGLKRSTRTAGASRVRFATGVGESSSSVRMAGLELVEKVSPAPL